MTCSEKRDHLQKWYIVYTRKSNIFCRKLQLFVCKHCISTDTNTKQKTVHYMYTTLHCRVYTSNILCTNLNEGLKIIGPFSQSRSQIYYYLIYIYILSKLIKLQSVQKNKTKMIHLLLDGTVGNETKVC